MDSPRVVGTPLVVLTVLANASCRESTAITQPSVELSPVPVEQAVALNWEVIGPATGGQPNNCYIYLQSDPIDPHTGTDVDTQGFGYDPICCMMYPWLEPCPINVPPPPHHSCNDERDYIIEEYINFGVALLPSCSSFTNFHSSMYFSWTELTWASPSIGPNPHTWGIIRNPLLAHPSTGVGLDKWREEFGGPRNINSGWRCPSSNFTAGGVAQSRHQWGDAIDLRNVSRTEAEWNSMYVAALAASADFIEPRSGPCDIGCVHADWRNH